jgi:phosphinothricin acetyltransferase
MKTRDAAVADASAIARIYNEGIDDRVATFETRHRTEGDVVQWFDGRHPVVIVEDDEDDEDDGGEVIAFAATSTYRPRDCYAGIAEFSVYASRAARGRGAGRMAMEALFAAAREAGFWKLVSRVFVENTASRALLRAVGFREVGVYERHGQLDGLWRDVVIVEKLL